ncbi:hypothetical protein C8J56DRAFT_1125003 [Mycena floridula]|nr:hypothetical protein C8J56DRAFT_1125003 [Mycena floridula]
MQTWNSYAPDLSMSQSGEIAWNDVYGLNSKGNYREEYLAAVQQDRKALDFLNLFINIGRMPVITEEYRHWFLIAIHRAPASYEKIKAYMHGAVVEELGHWRVPTDSGTTIGRRQLYPKPRPSNILLRPDTPKPRLSGSFWDCVPSVDVAEFLAVF